MKLDSSKEKVSNFRKGRFTGKDNPFYGKHHSEENKKHWSEMKQGEKGSFYGKKHSSETKKKLFIQKKDENNPMFNATQESNPNWKGGKSEYGVRWADRLKRKIKERDNYKCQYKLCKNKSKRIVIHHKDFNKKNNDDFNLITVCSSCHNLIHKRRLLWEE